MNMTDETCRIYPGINKTKASPVSKVKTVKELATIKNTNVPDHLAELHNRTVEGMDSNLQRQGANITKSYSSVSSETIDDIGQISVLKSRIPLLLHSL